MDLHMPSTADGLAIALLEKLRASDQGESGQALQRADARAYHCIDVQDVCSRTEITNETMPVCSAEINLWQSRW